MNEYPTTNPAPLPRATAILRFLFIVGFAINAILFFLASHTTKPMDLLGEDFMIRLSGWDYVNGLLLKGGHLGMGSGYAAVLVLAVMFAVLAALRPRRWVFILGAGYSLLWLLWCPGLCVLGHTNYPIVLPHVFNGIGSAITLPGFLMAASFRRPKSEPLAAAVPAQP